MKGKIVYVSPSLPGGQNDIAMAREFAKEFLSFFQLGDIIVGDEGFEGFESHADEPQIVTVNKSNPSFSSFSRQRIKIENVFAKMKRWRACADTLRTPCSSRLLIEHHETWVVVASFVNDFVNLG